MYVCGIDISKNKSNATFCWKRDKINRLVDSNKGCGHTLKKGKVNLKYWFFFKRICVHAQQNKYCSFFNVILAVTTESITRIHIIKIL